MSNVPHHDDQQEHPCSDAVFNQLVSLRIRKLAKQHCHAESILQHPLIYNCLESEGIAGLQLSSTWQSDPKNIRVAISVPIKLLDIT